MITIDAPISFLLGSGLAYAAAKKQNSNRDEVFLKGFILQSCVLSPVILFFMIRFADWEWNYLFNANEFFFGKDNLGIGATSIAILIALLNATYILGFKFSSKLIEQGKEKQVVTMLAGTLALIALIMLIMFKQTLHIGTLAEFQNGEAGLIFLNIEFLLAQTGAVVLLGLGFFYTMKSAKRN